MITYDDIRIKLIEIFKEIHTEAFEKYTPRKVEEYESIIEELCDQYIETCLMGALDIMTKEKDNYKAQFTKQMKEKYEQLTKNNLKEEE